MFTELKLNILNNFIQLSNNHIYIFFSYIFYGAVAFSSGHYVAYIRRSENKWELHNDVLKKIMKFSSTKEKYITPHLLVYIRLK